MKIRKKNIVEEINKVERFNPALDKGLTFEQVALRKSQGFINKTKKAVTKSYWEIIISNVFSLFNILLYIIAAFMFAAQLYTKMIFVIVLTLNIVIGLVQDIRARGIVDKLSLVSNPKATVIRESNKSIVPVNELVLDDLIELKAGDQIPADSIILEGSLSVNESFITGESEAIKKEAGDEVFAGSYVISGRVLACVDKVGNANYVSQIQNKARHFSRPKSEILYSFKNLFRIITLIVLAFAAAEIISYLTLQMNFVELVDTVSGSLVPMIPMGMYLLTSITLTVGVIVLARKRVVVHELYCIEMLARVNVLCLDKTGTLTDGTMEVSEYKTFNFKEDELSKYISSLLQATKDENITAKALLKKFGNKSYFEPDTIIPFSSENKYSAVTFKCDGTFAMGAFGFLKIKNHDEIKTQVEEYEKQGLRVIIFAKSNKKITNNKLPNDLEAVGLICLHEHIRDDAVDTINWFKENGVAIRIISGDSATSVAVIAKKVGVEGADKAISLDGMSLEKVAGIATEYTVFGRVSPEQKQVIVQSLQRAGKTVAMTGDGVNDILALKTADCSIAMASGADVAKTISHLVTLDNNFSCLPSVVEEGRRVINNLQRTCSLYLVKTIFAILVSLGFLIAFWIDPTSKYPFVTSHLYVWEWLTIGLASVCLALQPSKERLQGSFISNLFINAFPAGLMQSIIVAVMFMCSYINPTLFNHDSVLAMSVLLLTTMSYIALFKISMPMNKFRLIVFLTMVFLGLFIIGVDLTLCLTNIITSNDGSSFIFAIPYKELNWQTAVLGISIILVATPIYFLLAKYLKKIAIKISKKGEILE